MPIETDISTTDVTAYMLPIETRLPLKFGAEILTRISCARIRLGVRRADGEEAYGWGETPMSVQWVWPSARSYEERESTMIAFIRRLAAAWESFEVSGHAMEIGQAFQKQVLPQLLADINEERSGFEPMPHLAALVCCSSFDIALHDAFGVINDVPTYQTYNRKYMNEDLATWLMPAEASGVSFRGRFPQDYLIATPQSRIPAWHMVGGKDLIDSSELVGSEPDDGYPFLLRDWIRRDGIKCLKIKLVGNDPEWDYERLVSIGQIAIDEKVDWLTTDFNCTVETPEYVNDILDRMVREHPRIYGMILYVEQPFPYDIESNRIDVHSVSARKPLFMDESAHDWELVKLGRSLGWTGVALKTCKTQTGALLSLCWARAHGMTLMVQDLTNPMLAQIPHALLAAHAGTIMGVETNAMQFYPEASLIEAEIHPGLYSRREGVIDIQSLSGSGFGYRIGEIRRELPAPIYG